MVGLEAPAKTERGRDGPEGCPLLDGSGWINGDRINGLYMSPSYKWWIPWGEKTH